VLVCCSVACSLVSLPVCCVDLSMATPHRLRAATHDWSLSADNDQSCVAALSDISIYGLKAYESEMSSHVLTRASCIPLPS